MKRKADKQREADERNNAWSSLSPEQQLKELDKRPGQSSKQRKKISKQG